MMEATHVPEPDIDVVADDTSEGAERIEEAESRHPGENGVRGSVGDPSEIVLREMNIADIEMVVDWLTEDPNMAAAMLMPEGKSMFAVREDLLAGIRDNAQKWGVAERDGEPVGVVALKARLTCEAHIMISPHHRGGRTFVKVLDASLSHAEGLGVREIEAIVPDGNKVVVRVLLRQGFKDQGVRMMTLTFNRDEV